MSLKIDAERRNGPLVLEVGKTYKTNGGRKVQIVHYSHGKKGGPYLGVLERTANDEDRSVWLGSNGSYFNSSHQFAWNVTKEYKEPIVHKRDVVWLKRTVGKEINLWFGHVGTINFSTDIWTEVKRETVTYTEPEEE